MITPHFLVVSLLVCFSFRKPRKTSWLLNSLISERTSRWGFWIPLCTIFGRYFSWQICATVRWSSVKQTSLIPLYGGRNQIHFDTEKNLAHRYKSKEYRKWLYSQETLSLRAVALKCSEQSQCEHLLWSGKKCSFRFSWDVWLGGSGRERTLMTSLLSGAFPTSVSRPPHALEQGCGETKREMLWKSPESGESRWFVVRDVKAVWG